MYLNIDISMQYHINHVIQRLRRSLPHNCLATQAKANLFRADFPPAFIWLPAHFEGDGFCGEQLIVG